MKMNNMNYIIPPGETIKESVESLGMNEENFANKMFLGRIETKDLLNGKLKIDEKIALKLEKVLGVPAQFWLNLESRYRTNLKMQKMMKLKSDKILTKEKLFKDIKDSFIAVNKINSKYFHINDEDMNSMVKRIIKNYEIINNEDIPEILYEDGPEYNEICFIIGDVINQYLGLGEINCGRYIYSTNNGTQLIRKYMPLTDEETDNLGYKYWGELNPKNTWRNFLYEIEESASDNTTFIQNSAMSFRLAAQLYPLDKKDIAEYATNTLDKYIDEVIELRKVIRELKYDIVYNPSKTATESTREYQREYAAFEADLFEKEKNKKRSI